MQKLLTEREVADALRVSVYTLQCWRFEGRGPRFCRLGRAIRYRPGDLEDFIRVVETRDSRPAEGRGRR
jgi:hypothetical protein